MHCMNCVWKLASLHVTQDAHILFTDVFLWAIEPYYNNKMNISSRASTQACSACGPIKHKNNNYMYNIKYRILIKNTTAHVKIQPMTT
jgi:hypothetical protein